MEDCNVSPYENLKSTKDIPHLDRDRHGATGPNVAQARLLDQLTPGIVIGNTRGDAHPTAPGTLGPGSSLNHALISHLPPGYERLKTGGVRDNDNARCRTWRVREREARSAKVEFGGKKGQREREGEGKDQRCKAH